MKIINYTLILALSIGVIGIVVNMVRCFLQDCAGLGVIFFLLLIMAGTLIWMLILDLKNHDRN